MPNVSRMEWEIYHLGGKVTPADGRSAPIPVIKLPWPTPWKRTFLSGALSTGMGGFLPVRFPVDTSLWPVDLDDCGTKIECLESNVRLCVAIERTPKALIKKLLGKRHKNLLAGPLTAAP
jgi:hypothetical protein